MYLLEIQLYCIFFSQEKELLKKKQEEIEEAERLKRSKVVVTFDLVGRKVLALSNDLISTCKSFPNKVPDHATERRHFTDRFSNLPFCLAISSALTLSPSQSPFFL